MKKDAEGGNYTKGIDELSFNDTCYDLGGFKDVLWGHKYVTGGSVIPPRDVIAI